MRLDAQTLGVLYEREGRSLLVFASRRTLDAELAMDVVGETFAVAFERRGRFRGSTHEEAVAWLFAIARTVINHHFRRSGAELRALRRLGVERPALEDEERRRVEQLAGLEELHGRVGPALERLPADQRAAVELRVVQELSYEQIAERLGIAAPAARARVSRGLRALAVHLEAGQETADAH